MPSPRSTLAITRLRAVTTRLRILSSRTTTARLTKAVEDHVNRQKEMQKIIEGRFRSQSARSYGARRWAALKPSTIAARRRMGYGAGPILKRTASLKEAAKAAVAGTYRMAHSSIRWQLSKVRVPYGKYHQLGGGRLRPRPFFFQPDNSELQIADRIAARELRRRIRLMLRRRP